MTLLLVDLTLLIELSFQEKFQQIADLIYTLFSLYKIARQDKQFSFKTKTSNVAKTITCHLSHCFVSIQLVKKFKTSLRKSKSN